VSIRTRLGSRTFRPAKSRPLRERSPLRIANDRLTKFLEPHGYTPVAVTPGLWKHHTKDITFTLVVDDFGVKYTDKKDAEHLMACLKENYVVKEDWEGTRYCGLTIKWDYTRRLCYISMPGYITRCLQRFAHLVSKTPTHSPHAYTPPGADLR
jgi:hypothetical protein